MTPKSLLSLAAPLSLSALFTIACGPAGDAESPNRAPLADKWLTRAQASYKSGDFEDASQAAESALGAAPSDPDIRLLAARLALAKMEWGKAAKLTEGMTTADALSVRGRAHWYAGDVEAAADALEALLRDPAVKDPWARQIATLARTGGTSRKPFAVEGGLVAAVEMPPAGPAMVVPCELNGEHILALVATASSEVVIDSNSRKDPAWVTLRFGDRIEVSDVPAITQDLAPISRQLGGSIKALLGVNLLRHLHATVDRRGDQFVVRRSAATPPPDASRIPLWYVRGGGMLMRAGVTAKDEGNGAYLVDSSLPFPLALTDATWKKAGVDISKLQSDPSVPDLRAGPVPLIRFGSFDLPSVPAVQGAPTSPAQQSMDVDVDGVIGSGLIAEFRMTFGDEGRFVWIEPDPTAFGPRRGAAPPPPPAASAPDAAPLQLTPPPGAKPGPTTKPDPKAPAPKPGAKPAAGAKPEAAPKAAAPAATPAAKKAEPGAEKKEKTP
ncbi:MAG: hypothetical protein U0235_08005 [Polyangiaceae bacterium]